MRITLTILLVLTGVSSNAQETAKTPEAAKPETAKTPEAAAKSKRIIWQSTLEAAVEAAAKSSKLVLVDFDAEWCGWCKKLDRETWGDAKVIQFVTNRFVAVKVDADEHRDLMEHFKVSGLPTILFLDPATGAGKHADHDHTHAEDTGEHDHSLQSVQEVGRVEGFRPPQPFLVEAGKAVTAGSSLAELRKAATEKPKDAGAQRAYARALLIGGKTSEAERVLRDALERIPDSPAIGFELAEIDRASGRFDRAAEGFRKVLASKAASETLRDETAVPLARCLISLKQLGDAEKALAGLLAKVPAEIVEHAKKPGAGPLVAKGEDEDGAESLDARILEGLFLRGYVRALLERPDDALEDLRVARVADPDGQWGFRASFIIARLRL